MKTLAWAATLLLIAFGYGPSPMMADAPVRASVNSDGSLTLNGGAKFFDMGFGGADAGYTHQTPLGIKSITFAQHFYINGEKNPDLLQPPKNRNDGSLLIDGSGFHYNDHSKAGGWLSWCSSLANAIGGQWNATLPGQAQVLIEVDKDNKLRIAQHIYVPGVAANGRFITSANNPQVESVFMETINQALAHVSGSSVFPKNSTADSVMFLATFVSDHDLDVAIPDIRLVAIAGGSEPDLRIIRLCTILESGFMYDLSNHLRAQLKQKNLSAVFIPTDAPHRLNSIGHDTYFISYGADTKMDPLDAEHEKAAQEFLDRCLAKSDYQTAESFAKRLMSESKLEQREKTIDSYTGAAPMSAAESRSSMRIQSSSAVHIGGGPGQSGGAGLVMLGSTETPGAPSASSRATNPRIELIRWEVAARQQIRKLPDFIEVGKELVEKYLKQDRIDKVVLSATLDEKGNLRNLKFVEGVQDASPLLEKLIQSAAPFAPLPEGYSQTEIRFEATTLNQTLRIRVHPSQSNSVNRN